jgi:tetratricopeptide (TPR) repeat protein
MMRNAMAAGDQETIQQALQRALRHHGAGDLETASDIYQSILVRDPNQPFALHLSGVAAHQTGQLDLAEARITKAIEIRPDYAEAYCNLGNLLQDLGRFEAAVERYRDAIRIEPAFGEAHGNLGNALKALGRLDEAMASCRKAIEINPALANAHVNLGNALQESGAGAEAVAHYRQAVDIDPGFALAHGNLGNALQQLGRTEDALESYQRAINAAPDVAAAHANMGDALKQAGRLNEAVACYRNAIGIDPQFADAYCNLGATQQELGSLDDAISSYRRALALKPDFAEAHGNLGVALLEKGNPEESFACQCRAVAIDPANERFWSGMAASLEQHTVFPADDGLRQFLLDLLDRPTVPPSQLIRPILAVLRHEPAILHLLRHDDAEWLDHAAYSDAIERLSSNPLLMNFMALSIFNDVAFERLFTGLRRHMVLSLTLEENIDADTGHAFLTALALHCFTNEYAFQVTEDETAAVEALCLALASLTETGEDIPARLLTAIASYKPLYRLSSARRLADRDWAENLTTLVERQLREPLEEDALGKQIPRLTSIENAVSQAVRGQYEENPYPRWIKANLQNAPLNIQERLQSAPLCLDLGDFEPPRNPQILIAGCGTGQHALSAASRYADSSILAVDLSLRSLSYAVRKTQEYGFTNIEYAQADILELGGLERQFDLIECSGVLHHLDDPLAGWRVLLGLLRPGGLIKIGLYSEHGRQSVVEGRALIAEMGYSTTAMDIRRCRQKIFKAVEGGDPVLASLTTATDFFSLSACRDLLFHIQEHRFTLLQIDNALQSLGLEFLGFEMRDRQAMARFNEIHPAQPVPESLGAWHEFETENPDTFRSMYQFWCRKRLA